MRRLYVYIAFTFLALGGDAMAQNAQPQAGIPQGAVKVVDRPTTAPSPPPQTISDEALVRSVAFSFVAKALIVIEPVSTSGDHATAVAKIMDKTCTLRLTRQRAAAATGWLVEKMDCPK